MFYFLADGEGFEPPVELPPQRFSRPSQSTALPPIRNCFFAGLSNRRFCSLTAPGGAAHHSFALDCADACLADSYARPSQSTALPPIRNYFFAGFSNRRFCSLTAPGGAAHHSFALDCADACLADSYARLSQSTAALTHPKLSL